MIQTLKVFEGKDEAQRVSDFVEGWVADPQIIND